MQHPSAIRTHNLVKVYKGAETPALSGLDLHVPEGEIFGLLGPNGAGKTTTISILCGLLSPTSGTASVAGYDLRKDQGEIRHIIGIAPQEIALYNALSARENLRFIGSMYGLHGTELKDRIGHYLSVFGLEKHASRPVKTYSGGMKRRVNLIAGILHQPRILFLDEPTVGIDVQSRNVILEYLKLLNSQGTTIIYTSHYMEEAEQMCSMIAIIDQGRIITEGRPSELIGSQPEFTNLESIFLNITGRNLRDY